MNSKMYVDVMLATVLNRIKLYSNYQSSYESHKLPPSFAQSICTLISNLSGEPDIFLGPGTLKASFERYKVASTLFFSGPGPYFFCL